MASRTAGLLALIVLGTCAAFAQGFTQSITGTVRDASGAALPGAVVSVRQTETGLARAVEADATGSFNVPSLPVGPYEVSAEKAGFKVEVVRGIELVVAQEAVVNMTLQVGNMEQRVLVSAEAPLVNTTLAPTSG